MRMMREGKKHLARRIHNLRTGNSRATAPNNFPYDDAPESPTDKHAESRARLYSMRQEQ